MLATKLKVITQTLLTLFILVSVGFLSALTAMRFAIRGQLVAVPRLVGLTSGQAAEQLAARKLLLKVESRVYNETVSEGVIAAQDPAPGSALKSGRKVNVVLSLGKRKVPIPDLVGGTLRAAQINLVRRGLSLGITAWVEHSTVEKDRLVAQEPPVNSKEVLSPTVNVLLSRGPAETAFMVPDFIGMELNQASATVEGEGFQRGRVTVQPYSGVAGGIVIAQQPLAGSRIISSSAIDFTVSK